MATVVNTRLIEFRAHLQPFEKKKARAVKIQLETVKAEPRDPFF